MERYRAIESATFGEVTLPLPMWVRIVRRTDVHPAGGDDEAFPTSVQPEPPQVAVEVRIRDTSVAEGLSIGQTDVLTIQVGPTRSGQAGRTIRLTNAVLTGIELQYEQLASASATLRFQAETPDGGTDPFAAEETSP